MAVLAKLNADRCREVARATGASLSAAADRLVEIGWHSYSNDHLLGRELRRIRRKRKVVA